MIAWNFPRFSGEQASGGVVSYRKHGTVCAQSLHHIQQLVGGADALMFFLKPPEGLAVQQHHKPQGPQPCILSICRAKPAGVRVLLAPICSALPVRPPTAAMEAGRAWEGNSENSVPTDHLAQDQRYRELVGGGRGVVQEEIKPKALPPSCQPVQCTKFLLRVWVLK